MLAPHCPVPKEGVEHVEQYATHILTPSHFCAGLLHRSGFKLPISIVHHGIDQAFCDPRHTPDGFRFLHLASGDAHTLARKGTVETVEAFLGLKDRGHSRLAVVAPLTALVQLQALVGRDASDLSARGVDLVNRLEFEPSKMASVYRATSCVVQPSRVEGFGMVPLEARACGVPVIATCRTGHREHVPGESKDGVVVVDQDEDLIQGPMDLGSPLDVEKLRTAMSLVLSNWDEQRLLAVSACDEVRSRWSWHEVVKPFIEEREEWI
jgi:glycosyltransferase involved in cell wall biosynthesis